MRPASTGPTLPAFHFLKKKLQQQQERKITTTKQNNRQTSKNKFVRKHFLLNIKKSDLKLQ